MLFRHARMEHHLQKQVAKLLAQTLSVASLARVDRRVRLLEKVGKKGLVGLLCVPGAAAWGAQPIHDCDEVKYATTREIPRSLQDLDFGDLLPLSGQPSHLGR